ncbi:MAG: hypothetical protein AABY22_10345 [Nanoarchaeota archaeon]
MAEVFSLTEEGERYVFILRDELEGLSKYYMCEADMYTEASFGRGFGQWTDKKQKAEEWYFARAKLNPKEVVSREISNLAYNELLIKKKQQIALEEARGRQEGEFR